MTTYIIRRAGRAAVIVRDPDPTVALLMAGAIADTLERHGYGPVGVPEEAEIELWDKQARKDLEVRGFRARED